MKVDLILINNKVGGNMKKYLVWFFIISSLQILGCSVKVSDGVDTGLNRNNGKSGGPTDPSSPDNKEAPFNFDLNLNGTSLAGFAMAFPSGVTSTGEQKYQLRFFDKYETSLGYCDSSFYADEGASFKNLFLLNILGVKGKRKVSPNLGWYDLDSGSISLSPFNTFWDAEGSYEITKVFSYGVQGNVTAKDHWGKLIVKGKFEAYLCGDEGEKRILKEANKELLGPEKDFEIMNQTTGERYSVNIQFEDFSGHFNIFSKYPTNLGDKTLNFSTQNLSLKSSYIMVECGQGEEIVGRITPQGMEYKVPSKDCFSTSSILPPQEMSIKKENGKVILDMTTFSGVNFKGTWKN